jgi:hypothetical protein
VHRLTTQLLPLFSHLEEQFLTTRPLPIFFVERGTDVSDDSRTHKFVCASLTCRIRTAVVIGDFVFIDGGEISQLVNGIADPGQGGVPGGYTPGSRQSK